MPTIPCVVGVSFPSYEGGTAPQLPPGDSASKLQDLAPNLSLSDGNNHPLPTTQQSRAGVFPGKGDGSKEGA